jgi:ABC-type multidrug transport system permease subunit
MHLSQVVWWIYTALIALAALFFLIFAHLVKEKGK